MTEPHLNRAGLREKKRAKENNILNHSIKIDSRYVPYRLNQDLYESKGCYRNRHSTRMLLGIILCHLVDSTT